MMIVSAKVSRKKLLLGVLAALCLMGLLVVLCLRAGVPAEDGAPSLRAVSNEDRLAYLASFGWKVQEEPVETREVRIPEEFNEVFTRYNQLQQSQGFDLADYAGKTARRYVYAITNYPDGTPDHYVTILVCQNRIIGGDVSGRGEGSRMHGFAMPQTA